MTPKVSVIIPLPFLNDYLREAIGHYRQLNFKDFELIVLPDVDGVVDAAGLDMRIIPTGKVGPAEKRDVGAKAARGELLAFTDDDAYPAPGWLSAAVPHFSDSSVGSVGGPAVTPPGAPLVERISGNIFESPLMSWKYRKRYVAVGGVHEDYDLPSVNLIVRKSVFDAVGGFDSTFYPGEDTKLCLEIKQRGHKIIYDPAVLVFHHRRNSFRKHFAQIANYGRHRGFFAHRYPETSNKPAYYIPSLFVLGLLVGAPLSFVSALACGVYCVTLCVYFALNVVLSFRLNPLEWVLTVCGVFLSHVVYGGCFMRGLLFTKELKR